MKAHAQHDVLALARRDVVGPGAPRIEIETEGIQAIRADLLGKALEKHPPPQSGEQNPAILGYRRAQIGCQQAHRIGWSSRFQWAWARAMPPRPLVPNIWRLESFCAAGQKFSSHDLFGRRQVEKRRLMVGAAIGA
jgi:hypothetical protein